MNKRSTPPEDTDDNSTITRANSNLGAYVGMQIRERRNRLGLTIADLAQASGNSTSNLSKIETGMVSPSLHSIAAISQALSLSVDQLFCGYDDDGGLIYIPHGKGLQLQHVEGSAGMTCEFLVANTGQLRGFQPYVVTLSAQVDNSSAIAHPGTQLIYILEGGVEYRYGRRLIRLGPGDTVIFDTAIPHGPASIRGDHARYFCLILDAQVMESARASRSTGRKVG